MTKISVLMTTFNSGKYLKECIDSIINQTFQDFEFIISDGGSNDNTVEIIEKYIKVYPKIILLKNKEKTSITKCMNDCYNISKGYYIAIMESDDVSNLNRLQEQNKFLDNNNEIGFIGSKCNYINEKGNKIGEVKIPLKFNDIKKIILLYSPFINPSIMIRRNIIEKYGFYDEKFDIVQDYEYWLRLISNGIIGINIENILLNYRNHNNNTSKIKNKYIIEKNKKLREIYKNKLGVNLNFKDRLYIFADENYDKITELKIFKLLKKIGIYKFISNIWNKYFLKK